MWQTHRLDVFRCQTHRHTHTLQAHFVVDLMTAEFAICNKLSASPNATKAARRHVICQSWTLATISMSFLLHIHVVDPSSNGIMSLPNRYQFQVIWQFPSWCGCPWPVASESVKHCQLRCGKFCRVLFLFWVLVNCWSPCRKLSSVLSDTCVFFVICATLPRPSSCCEWPWLFL